MTLERFYPLLKGIFNILINNNKYTSPITPSVIVTNVISLRIFVYESVIVAGHLNKFIYANFQWNVPEFPVIKSKRVGFPNFLQTSGYNAFIRLNNKNINAI